MLLREDQPYLLPKGTTMTSPRGLPFTVCHCIRVGGVERWNTWLLEVEGIDWIGAYHLSGKKNYVIEGCHRIDTLYGGRLTEDELEWCRVNQFFLITEGKGAMSLGRTNELLMLWNKSCVPTQRFSTACSQSRVLLVAKACAREVFDVRSRKSVAPSFKKMSEI